jgi:hypothetical protein
MPLPLRAGASTLIVRREAFERTSITRSQIDVALTLTDDEFRVEQGIIAIGPIYDEDGLVALVEAFEAAGLEYDVDYCELSGGWPDWVKVLVMG